MSIKQERHGYSIVDFARLLGRSRVTLQRWDRMGRLKAYRLPSGHRFYTQEPLDTIKGDTSFKEERRTVIYCRVSSASQKADLRRQVQAMEAFCIGRGTGRPEIVMDISSALSYKRKHFLATTDAIIAGEIAEVIVAHKHRLVRFGFEWFEHLCATHGTRLTVVNAAGGHEALSADEAGSVEKDLA